MTLNPDEHETPHATAASSGERWLTAGEDRHAVVRAALAWWSGRGTEFERDADDHVAATHAISAAEDWLRIARDLQLPHQTRVSILAEASSDMAEQIPPA